MSSSRHRPSSRASAVRPTAARRAGSRPGAPTRAEGHAASAPAGTPGDPAGTPAPARVPTTSFVGRADELAALQARLGESRLVTVLGAPGTGKTRLCRELVERERAAGRRTVFCDLTEAEDLVSLCGAVARALDVPLGGAGDAAGAARAIGAALSRMGRPLVVLDNFEQVVDLAPATVGSWLDDAPAAAFLVTSRQRLGVAGEALFDLGPLALPEPAADPETSEAFQLFVQRARLVRRDFQPDAEESRTVAALVRELDGLPLAIELCAARLRTLSPAQLLSRMAQRFELLSAPGAAGKATTLRGALESSWEMLDAAERTTLAECAVFRGGFTLEAAEAVVDLGEGSGAPWLLDVLEALVDKSLLITYAESTSQRRFGMLVSIRELGLDKLVEMGHSRQIAVRHARYYLDAGRAWTHALSGANAARSRHLLGLETENLLAIHRRALELGQGPAALPTALTAALVLAPLLSTQGPFGMLLALLDAPLVRAREAEGVDLRLLARAHDARAVALRYMGRSTEALADARRAVELAESTGDERLLARVMTTLSVNELVLGDWQQARAHVERALVVHRAAGDQSSEGRALAALGDTWFYEDRLDEAQKSYAAALAIHRQLGERASEGVALSRLASVAMERGDAPAARELYRGSVELHREVGDRRALASTSGYLAILEQEEGDLAAAEQRFRDAIELAREIENRRTEGIFTGYLAGCLLEMGRLDEAAETYQRAVDITAEVGASSTCALFQAGLGALRAQRGDLAGAEAILSAAEAQLGQMREQTFVAAAVDLFGGFLDIARGAPRSAACRLAKAGGGLSQTDVRFAARLLERALDAAGEPPFEGAIDGGDGASEPLEGGPDALSASGPPTLSPPMPGAGSVPADAPADALVVARSGRWFRAPHGEVVGLQRRRALRLIIAALASQRAQQPDAGIDLHAVAAAGWPGERLHPEAAADRVYTAIATLRRMGLRTALLSRDDGYLLDARLPFVTADG